VLSGDLYGDLLQGVLVTLQVTGLAAVLGTLLALIGGIATLSANRVVRWLTIIYVELFRGVAAIILLFWVFFTAPQLFDLFLSPLQAGVLALGTNMGAYGTEIVRGAIQAVPEGQTEASIALNLTGWQRLRYVVLPQAAVTMLPPFGNLLIEVLKASALVSLITLRDLTWEAQNLRVNRAADSVLIFANVLVMYFVLSGVITLVVRQAEKYFSRGLHVRPTVKARRWGRRLTTVKG